jgi:CubicO group peptidase (beta-lactamase class C family)
MPSHFRLTETIFFIVFGIAIAIAIPIGYSDAVYADEPTAAEKFQQLSSYVRKTMAETAVPGVAIGILHDGQVHTAGFGITNVDNPLPVTDDTLFQIGSITKTMTGTIIMRLAEQGKLDLDAPVRRYLPKFSVQDESVAANVRVKDLLTHMGGWVGDYFSSTGEGADALERIVQEMADLQQLAPLNSVWSYNNSGFYAAGRIIEVVTGQSYEVVLQELVFDAIGLDHTYIIPTDVMTRRFAVGHNVSDDGISVAEPWPLYRAVWAVGGAITNVGDMLKYAGFHMGDGRNAEGARVMKQQSLAAMQAVHAPKIGTDDMMGLTWHLSDVGSKRTVSHGGGTTGQNSVLLMVPEEDFALAIVTNANSGRALRTEVSRWALEYYFGAKDELPQPRLLTPDEVAQYTGTYSRPYMDVFVTAEDGRLMIQSVIKQGFMSDDLPAPPPPSEFGLYADDRIIEMDGKARGEFVRKADGSIGWLRLPTRINVKQ